LEEWRDEKVDRIRIVGSFEGPKGKEKKTEIYTEIAKSSYSGLGSSKHQNTPLWEKLQPLGQGLGFKESAICSQGEKFTNREKN